MKGIINAFEWLIQFCRDIWTWISTTFQMIGKAFVYIGNIVQMIINYMLTVPVWIKGIIWLTLFVSVMYIVIGRTVGKSD